MAAPMMKRLPSGFRGVNPVLNACDININSIKAAIPKVNGTYYFDVSNANGSQYIRDGLLFSYDSTLGYVPTTVANATDFVGLHVGNTENDAVDGSLNYDGTTPLGCSLTVAFGVIDWNKVPYGNLAGLKAAVIVSPGWIKGHFLSRSDYYHP